MTLPEATARAATLLQQTPHSSGCRIGEYDFRRGENGQPAYRGLYADRLKNIEAENRKENKPQ